MIKNTVQICLLAMIASMALASVPCAWGEIAPFQQKLQVSLAEPVVLNVAVSNGDLQIGYSRDGEVSIYAWAKDAKGNKVSEEFFRSSLLVIQSGNRITVQDSATGDTALSSLYSILYKIDVPYRTSVYSTVNGIGNQLLMGVSGPARLTSGIGNIEALYVRFAPLEVSTQKGNITCNRVLQVTAETGDGNITLMEDGPSKAVVRKGKGRIEVGGARGRFEGATDSGSLHIKAGLLGDWRLSSVSGAIRIELPPKAAFEIDANTLSGEISVEREGLQAAANNPHQLHEQVKGGGKHIDARSIKGSIFLE